MALDLSEQPLTCTLALQAGGQFLVACQHFTLKFARAGPAKHLLCIPNKRWQLGGCRLSVCRRPQSPEVPGMLIFPKYKWLITSNV